MKLYKSIASQLDSAHSKSLWGNFGELCFIDFESQKAVAKISSRDSSSSHPRIFQTDIARQRKWTSYKVEESFYRNHSQSLRKGTCPNLLASDASDTQRIIVLEDFNSLGYVPLEGISHDEIKQVIDWLAYFHAHFVTIDASDLWPQGNYWHFDTRPDEYHRMAESELKLFTPAISNTIQNCPFKTVIHGDAKKANFAVNFELGAIMGYDFQYTGRGVGVGDVMLFLTSILDDKGLHTHAENILDYYFDQLYVYLSPKYIDHQNLISHWRELWPIVWADFYRFLLGWKPNHFKINSYMKSQTKTALRVLSR